MLRCGVGHSLSKANSLIAHVELCVPFANEDVSKDPPVAHLGRKVEAHKARDALGLTSLVGHLLTFKLYFVKIACLSYLQYIIMRSQTEGLTTKHEVNVGQGVNLVTVHKIFSSTGDQLQTSDPPVDIMNLSSCVNFGKSQSWEFLFDNVDYNLVNNNS